MATVSSAGVRVLVVVTLGFHSLEGVALAQRQPRADISAAYQEVIDTSLARSGMRREGGARGWVLDVAVPIARRLSLVGAIDGSYGEETEAASSFGGGTAVSSWTDITYLAGVRFHAASPPRISPFVQVLAGALRSRQKTEYRTQVPAGPYTFSEDVFLLNLGGGISVSLTPRLGLRLGGDLRIDPAAAALEGDDTTMARVLAGMVFKIP